MQQIFRIQKTHLENTTSININSSHLLAATIFLVFPCQSNKRFLCDPGISVVAMVRSTQIGCLRLDVLMMNDWPETWN